MENQNRHALVPQLLNCAFFCENCAAQSFKEVRDEMMEKNILVHTD